MIAADENFAELAGAGDDLVGIAAIADRVSEVDDEIVRGSGREAGVEGLEVAVDIAE
jgi:hypothetical protein